jgi:hypothetical protein
MEGGLQGRWLLLLLLQCIRQAIITVIATVVAEEACEHWLVALSANAVPDTDTGGHSGQHERGGERAVGTGSPKRSGLAWLGAAARWLLCWEREIWLLLLCWEREIWLLLLLLLLMMS